MAFSHTPIPTCLLKVSLLLVLVTIASARKVNLKINLGGPPVDGFSGEEQILQLGEEAVKTRYHGSITGNANDLQVFQTQRFARYEDLVINIPVPNGIYSVTLMFAETWKGAFNAGKRVFDVYLGSKPGGVVKVADSFDPFRSGGPAAPVRRKYDHIAAYDGLTVALRPIAQNPQIAGIIVSGFSYSESFIDELPTIAGDPSEIEDFSVLNNIGPKLPVDPSLIYDPTLNPKFKDKKRFHAGAARSNGPVHVNTVGRTSVHTQQTLFTPSSPNAGSSATAIDFSAHKSAISSLPKAGHNSLLNRPAPRPLSPGGAPYIGLRPGTVRVAVANDGALFLPHSAQHNLEVPPSSLPPSHKLQRHGRRLASIPVQTEDQPLPYGHGLLESTMSDQNSVAQSFPNHAPSTAFSEPPSQNSSQRAFSSYPVGLQTQENAQTQAVGDMQAERYTGIPSAGSSSEVAQHDSHATNSSPDMYSQGNRESEKAFQQPRPKSFQAAPHLVSQPESGVQPSKPDSELSPASHTPSSAGMMKPPVYVPTLGAKLTDTRSHSLAGQENDEQNPPPPSGGRHHVAPPGIVQSIPAQGPAPFRTEGIDLRKEAGLTTQNRESSSLGNAVNGNADGSHLQSIVGTNIEPSDSSKGVQNQMGFEGLESARVSQMGQQRTAMRPDSYDSGSTESPSLVDAPTRTAGLALYQIKMATERQNEVRDYKGNVISHPNAGNTQNRHNVKTVPNPDAVVRQDRHMTELGREEGYPVASSRSVRKSSGEHDLDTSRLSSFHDTNFRAKSWSMADAVPPGVHNGIGKLDGLCIDNSTHCSCGMVEQRPEAQEECLFIIDETRNPMACTIRPCNGKVICACASGASALCQRSLVKNILVRAPTPTGMDDLTTVACRRETIEEGVMVLTPIL